MPSRINTYPRGLLGLLDAKTGGQTPTELSSSVNMTLDALPFYRAQKGEARRQDSAAIAGTGAIFPGGVNFSCLESEILLVDLFSIQLNGVLGAGEFVGMVPMVRKTSQSGQLTDIFLANREDITAPTTPVLPICTMTTGPLLLVPGDLLGAFVWHRLIAVNTIRFSMQVTTFPI